jgi:hypothetical protein
MRSRIPPRPAPREGPPRGLAMFLGLLLGASAGLLLGGWERMLLQAAGVAVAQDASWAVPWAGAGLVFGGLAAATGLYGSGWSIAAALGLLGYVSSAQLGATLSGPEGAPAWLGVAFGTAVGAGLGQLLGHSGLPPALQQGTAALAALVTAVLAPLHLHVLPGATISGSLVFSALVLVLLVALAGVASIGAEAKRAPWMPIGLGSLVAALGLVPWGAPPGPAGPTADTPPLVLVVIDGLRADRMGSLGYPRRITPVLDELARTSLVYEGAHSTSNWTVPSLGSVLTGRLPHAHGAGMNGGRRGLDTPLRPDIKTLPFALGEAGIWSAAVVGDPRLRTFALDAGFDEWHDDPGQGAIPAAMLPLTVAGHRLVPALRWPRRAPAPRVIDQALALLERWPARGWFLMVHLADAGGPFAYTREDLRTVGLTTRPYPSDQYDAAVLRLDRELGRLLEALPPEAWVVVTGSRGVSLGETRTGWTGREQARFGHHMFEELVHVPLLVRAPGVEPRRIQAMVSLVDLAPTLVRAVDHHLSPRLDGAPLSEPFDETRIDRAVIAHSSLYGPEQQMVIVGGHKLVRTADGRHPMYDLGGDPAETTPLREAGAENASRQRRLGAMLPQSGSLVRQPPLVWQVGQIMSRFLEDP